MTATLAGQAVMQGFVDLRVQPWVQRLVTRGVAIVPAAFVTILYGESGTGKLLIASQVVLSLQLPFAVVPPVVFTASRAKMGALVESLPTVVLGGADDSPGLQGIGGFLIIAAVVIGARAVRRSRGNVS